MKFQLFSIFILTLFFQNMNAQDFKPDWKGFTSEKYNIAFQTNVTTFYGIDTVGELHFQLKSNPSIYLIFFVFERSRITLEFDPESNLSCILFDEGEFQNYKQYHYLPSPWQNCETANDPAFKGVYREIWNFIIK